MLVAFMWTALFGMAVLAVDFGYLYTKRRGVQSVADSAVRAAMPSYAAGNGSTSAFNAAFARAVDVAGRNNYVDNGGSTRVIPDSPVAGQFRVRISRDYPTFFGSLFGLGTKTVTGTTVGQITPGGGGGGGNTAIYSSDPGCSAHFSYPAGVQIGGSGILVVNGDVSTLNNIIEMAAWDASCTPATCKVTGAANSACAVFNDSPGNLGIGSTGATSVADPLLGTNLATLLPRCTVGTFSAPLDLTPYWNPEVGGCQTLQQNIYCSDGSGLNVVPTGPSKTVCPSVASFFSAGQVGIMADGAITFTAHPNANGFLVYSDLITATCGPSAVDLHNGAFASTFSLTGNIYAPNGCINFSSNNLSVSATGTIDGRLIAISMGAGRIWNFTSPSAGGGGGGGGGGGTWSVIQ